MQSKSDQLSAKHKTRTNDWFQILFAKGTQTDAVVETADQASIWVRNHTPPADCCHDVDVETGSPDDHNAGPLDDHPTDFATNLQWYLQLGIYLCQFLGLTDHSWGDSGNLWNFHEFSPEKSYKATP